MTRFSGLMLGLLPLISNSVAAESKEVLKERAEKVKKMSKCEQVKALINEHQNGFEKIRKKKTTNKFADIWTARYHLVGEGCQVFRWKNKKFSYTCSVTSPGEKVAIERYRNAKSQISACLGDEWTLEERPRHGEKGVVAVYSHKDHKTSVATHAFETNGIFNDEWTNYVFVGDKKRMKK